MSSADELIRRLKKSTFEQVTVDLVHIRDVFINEYTRTLDTEVIKKGVKAVEECFKKHEWTEEEYDKENTRRNEL